MTRRTGIISTIRVINPNSNTVVTAEISKALDPFRTTIGMELDCVTLEEGPFGIESQADVCNVEPLIADFVQSDTAAKAFIISCYSDPGLTLCREVTDRPVFGIAECAMLTALTRAQSFGVISINSKSILRHARYMRELLLHNHCSGDRALELTVAEVASSNDTFGEMERIGKQLRDKDGARCIIMGCAGMARYRIPLEESLGLPVIDPTQAAAGLAISAVHLANAVSLT